MACRRAACVLLSLPLALAITGCSGGPSAPAKGTPEFSWLAAKETFAAGDYTKTSEHLDNILRTENQYTARAQPWRLVLTAGLVKGYIDLAETFESGARANRRDPTPFRRQVTTYRTLGGQLSLQFAEVFEKFEKTKPAEVLLDFSFPQGTTAPVPVLAKVKAGVPLGPAEIESAQAPELQRAVLLGVTRAVGAGEDAVKAREMFKTLPVKLSRETFFAAMAEELLTQADLYSSSKLDRPDRQKFFLTHAQEALAGVPDSKATKALKGKIQAAMKKVRR